MFHIGRMLLILQLSLLVESSPSVFSGPADVDEDARRSVSGGVLKLTDVEFADTAVYQCEASNKHGSVLLNTYLYVVGT